MFLTLIMNSWKILISFRQNECSLLAVDNLIRDPKIFRAIINRHSIRTSLVGCFSVFDRDWRYCMSRQLAIARLFATKIVL